MSKTNQAIDKTKVAEKETPQDQLSRASQIAAKTHAMLHQARTGLKPHDNDVGGCFDVHDGKLTQKGAKS